MRLEDLAAAAIQRGASDLHLEPGLPMALRIQGDIVTAGPPIRAAILADYAREILGERRWKRFLERKSEDLSRILAGVRCRINVMRTSRGVGLAVRLLSNFQPTIQRLNLHPDLRNLIRYSNGLLLFTGPTGCGKSSTMAALLHEINAAEPRHIVTIEHPIEYAFRPRRSYIRQREVGRDTPSFDQGIIDAMREDPDVLMVGEMRDPETMRLTLNAAETGHLVLTTMHSSNCAEALQRMASAFPTDVRSAICHQIADALRAVVAQRLVHREDLGIRVPELEVLVATTPIRTVIRQGAFFKLRSALETGVQDGQWSFQRYRQWLEKQTSWFIPEQSQAEPPDADPSVESATNGAEDRIAATEPAVDAPEGEAPSRPRRKKKPGDKDVIVIEPPKEESIRDILSELDES